MSKPKQIILASSSPRRRFLLEEAGYSPSILKIDYKENLTGTESIYEAPLLLSQSKAEQCPTPEANQIIITCDTIVAHENKILGKPQSPEQAEQFLKSFSNKSHLVISGTTILTNSRKVSFNTISEVFFHPICSNEITKYIKTGSPMDKAGAYGIQDSFGINYVKEIKGCYYNIMGLPVSLLKREIDLL